MLSYAKRRLLIVALLILGAGAATWIWLRDRELADPDVKRMYVDCGTENDPPGLHMPAWPTGKQQYWTRQHWAGPGELKVEVWEFLEPGHRLISATRKVSGNRIVIEPRWVIPFMGAAAACYEKFGVEVTFHDLPRLDYVVEAR
jgi:hypothetical protein